MKDSIPEGKIKREIYYIIMLTVTSNLKAEWTGLNYSMNECSPKITYLQNNLELNNYKLMKSLWILQCSGQKYWRASSSYVLLLDGLGHWEWDNQGINPWQLSKLICSWQFLRMITNYKVVTHHSRLCRRKRPHPSCFI